ncbi:hypothetical protein BO71DRAFT_190719 [Aspergillus ellipticus CBS 707.79]|uniref:Uncharacterized protein n=1 Tax=Aspergillus ellipticus CBS 707.79 TaxID=1448320 RepID=A0A319DPA2_9EURO|nr:hypothetical protein BO71DRAFT_190719 [Aspergillus ellipticus CBS 707.79]
MRTNQPSSRGLSLHTSFSPDPSGTDCYAMPVSSFTSASTIPSHHPPAGPSSSSSTTPTPLSSTTASPTSSPTSSPFPFRHFHHHRLSLTRDPISLNHSNNNNYNNGNTSPSSRSQSPFRLSYSSLLRRPSLMLLRRRPSKVDMALCEERSRCGEDAIERQGLDLMEPRPVDPLALSMDSMDASVFSHEASSIVGDRSSTQSNRLAQQPRFVMGGIFEVMEGRG